MKFLKLDKKKGSGGPSIKSRYAYLIHIDDIDYLPGTNEKGVRLEGDILLKEDCTMMPLYLTSSSQEFSYDNLGDDDEKSYLVKFSGNHPGTELEALEFAKNMIEQPYLVLIPSCNESEPWKLLGELTNPLIFTSSHKGGSDSSKFTFNFEQRIGSEFIYFSYGGVEVPSDDGGGVQPPSGGFDPTKWARIDASNIDDHIAAWRTKLGIGSGDTDFTQHGPITTTPNSVTIGLSELGENFAMIGGTKYIEPTTNPETPKPFTPVTTGNKVLIIEARPDAQVFHLVEGPEDTVITDPPYTGLLVARVIVTPTGVIIQEEDSTNKNKSDDTIAPIILNNDTATWVFGDRTNYDITATGLVTAPILAGFKYADSSPAIWNGKKSIIRNRTGFPLLLKKVTPPVDGLIYFPFKQDYTIADGKDAQVIYDNNNEVALIEIGGGASFPELGNDGEVLVKSGTNALWSSIIKGVEFLGNAWLKLKLISFQGYTIAEKNLIASPTEGMLIYQNESPKGFQKYEGGAWVKLEQNLFNTDLQLYSNRNHSLNGNKIKFTNGRFSLPALEMEITSSNSVPNKIWTDGSDLWITDSAGINKKAGDDPNINLLKNHVFNSNVVIQPTAIDYSTGIITCAAHGLTVGTFAQGAILVPKSFNSGDITNIIRDWKGIPYEYTTTAFRIYILSTTTIRIQNNGGTVIPVNATSTENNGNLNISYWQVELRISGISDPSFFNDLPMGVKNIKLEINGIFSGSPYIISPLIYDMSGIILDNTSNSPVYSPRVDSLYIRNGLELAVEGGKMIELFNVIFEFSTSSRINALTYQSTEAYRAAGASSFTTAFRSIPNSFVKFLSVGFDNKGLAGIGWSSMYANGTTIKIFKR